MPCILLAALMSLLLIWKHSSNIGRLARGEEPKIGDNKIGDSNKAGTGA